VGLDWRDASSPRGLLAALVLAFLVVLVVAGSTSTAAFGLYNGAWDGASGVRAVASSSGADATVVTNASAYDDVSPNGTVAFVVAPTEPYTAGDRARLRAFVRSGGTLVVAEDVGDGGNEVLRSVGADARFDGRLVRDMRNHGPTTAMPLADPVENVSAFAAVDEVMLNHGTVVDAGDGNVTVLATTSEYAYLDVDDDDEADENETFAARPVVTAERVGEGRVVAVSDPSVFINAMTDRASNEAFLRALVGGNERVLLDHSHSGSTPPVRAALLFLRGSPLAQVAVGAALLGVAFGWSRRRD
jgi:hypothetical protein